MYEPTKPPVKKGEKISVIGECKPCDGRGYYELGDCDRGCCGNMVKEKCSYCDGVGKKNYNYVAKLFWGPTGSTSISKAKRK